MPDFIDSGRLIATSMFLAIGALFPIVDPLSGAPIYLQFIGGVPADKRPALARAVAADSFLLLASVFVGAYVLDFFGISIPSVQVGGGLVVCVMGWRLLNAPDAPVLGAAAPAAEAKAVNIERRAFYPLTMPLTVGPGPISVAITLGAHPHERLRTLVGRSSGMSWAWCWWPHRSTTATATPTGSPPGWAKRAATC